MFLLVFQAVIFYRVLGSNGAPATGEAVTNEREDYVVRRCGGNQPAALTSGCYLRGMQRQLLVGEGHSFAQFLSSLRRSPNEAFAAYAVRANGPRVINVSMGASWTISDVRRLNSSD